MSTSVSEVPFLKSAANATQRAADTASVEAALDELHSHIFGAAVSVEASAGALLRNVSDARGLLSRAEIVPKNQLDTRRLLLDAVFTLSEMLASAAKGRKVRSKFVNKLEDVVLPILFIRSNVTPELLRKHALKTPYAAFEVARQNPTKEVEELNLTFASWRANHGWDFAVRQELGHTVSEAVAPALVHTKAVVNERRSDGAGGTADQQRTVLRDVPRNATMERSGVTGIPSYLLTKRRRVCGTLSGACNVPPADLPHVASTSYHSPHLIIDSLHTEPDSTVLALKSPLKRRKIDFNMGIPPSPDRPGRCL
ncbi:hypothetical protein N2W54_003712 [Lotmaria passim]